MISASDRSDRVLSTLSSIVPGLAKLINLLLIATDELSTELQYYTTTYQIIKPLFTAASMLDVVL